MSMENTISKKALLVVDDDVLYGRALARLMKNHWRVVKCSSTVGQALVEMATGQYDVVLSDWNMPDGGGERVIQEATVPVVIYTGACEDVIAMIQSKGVPALMKPSPRRKLIAMLYQAITANGHL